MCKALWEEKTPKMWPGSLRNLKAKLFLYFPNDFAFLNRPQKQLILLFWFQLLTRTILFFIVLITFSFLFLFQFMATWHHKITSHRHCLISFYDFSLHTFPSARRLTFATVSGKQKWSVDGRRWAFTSNNQMAQMSCVLLMVDPVFTR